MSHRGFGLLALPVMAVLLAGCGGGSSTTSGGGSPSPAASLPAGAKEVDVVADPNTVGAYQPGSVNVKVGDTVGWLWKDQANPHTVTSDDGTTFNEDNGGSGFNAGHTFTFTFKTAGTYKYHCSLHSGMSGTIVVS